MHNPTPGVSEPQDRTSTRSTSSNSEEGDSSYSESSSDAHRRGQSSSIISGGSSQHGLLSQGGPGPAIAHGAYDYRSAGLVQYNQAGLAEDYNDPRLASATSACGSTTGGSRQSELPPLPRYYWAYGHQYQNLPQRTSETGQSSDYSQNFPLRHYAQQQQQQQMQQQQRAHIQSSAHEESPSSHPAQLQTQQGLQQQRQGLPLPGHLRQEPPMSSNPSLPIASPVQQQQQQQAPPSLQAYQQLQGQNSQFYGYAGPEAGNINPHIQALPGPHYSQDRYSYELHNRPNRFEYRQLDTRNWALPPPPLPPTFPSSHANVSGQAEVDHDFEQLGTSSGPLIDLLQSSSRHVEPAASIRQKHGKYHGQTSESSPEVHRSFPSDRPQMPHSQMLESGSLPVLSSSSQQHQGMAGQQPLPPEHFMADQFPSLHGIINIASNGPGQQPAPTRSTRTTTVAWEEETTLCIIVEYNSTSIARRCDNNMINGTKLLNVAGMTRGRRDGILKSERVRHVVKIGNMYLKGVWIPFERALEIAQREGLLEQLYPLFVADMTHLLYDPPNLTRTRQVVGAAQRHNPQFVVWMHGIPHHRFAPPRIGAAAGIGDLEGSVPLAQIVQQPTPAATTLWPGYQYPHSILSEERPPQQQIGRSSRFSKSRRSRRGRTRQHARVHSRAQMPPMPASYQLPRHMQYQPRLQDSEGQESGGESEPVDRDPEVSTGDSDIERHVEASVDSSSPPERWS